MSKQIIVIKPKRLSSVDKAKLTKDGNIVIESESGKEIIYHQLQENVPYTYTNCWCCGERIYLLEERLRALKSGKCEFFCSHGHRQKYS